MAGKKKPVYVDVAAIGSKGGKARAATLTREQRSESARKAVQARWAKAGKTLSKEPVASKERKDA